MSTSPLMQIKKPTLMVDMEKARQNVVWMKHKAEREQVCFRPHFKTHQSHAVAAIYRSLGVSAITVSSLQMAIYFAANGWDDILIAFPLNIREMEGINALAAHIHLGVLVDGIESARYLQDHAETQIGVWIKIDTGLHRAGIWWEDAADVQQVIAMISSNSKLSFQGILTHAGHTYHAQDALQAQHIALQSKEAMLTLQGVLQEQGHPDLQVSIGDTPGCRLLPDFSGVDEIRPGNFIFYDLEQWHIGVCGDVEMAVALACPVVSRNRQRSELVLYGGSIHFAKETISYQAQQIYGMLAKMKDGRFQGVQPENVIIQTTQEHGVLRVSEDIFSQTQIGDVVLVYPVHSCLMVQAMGTYMDIATGEKIPTMVTQCEDCV